jgi:hypothetical protein
MSKRPESRPCRARSVPGFPEAGHPVLPSARARAGGDQAPLLRRAVAHPSTNGFGTSVAVLSQTHLVCRYASIASMPFSRPRPEAL